MKNVRKMDGRLESFNRAKIVQSVLRAGGDEKLAISIANAVPEEVALTTANIRQKVANELTKKDKEIARRYWETRRLVARKSVDAAEGSAKLAEEAMSRLSLRPGDPLQICYAENKHNVMADEGAADPGNIQLHENDLTRIGATEGNRIAVRRVR
ncbi:MAG: ATP cone domain-containing protein [Thermoplasmata archaeon]